MSSRVTEFDKLKGLTWECPDCGHEMTATGKLEYNEGTEHWMIPFWCPNDQWIVPYWNIELDPLIKELTKDLDPSTLPYEGS